MSRLQIVLGIVVLALLAPCGRAGAEVKNVILMVGDGAGFNCWDAASMYQGRWDRDAGRSRQVYDGPGWIRLGCTTFPLNLAKNPAGTGQQNPGLVYDPDKAWDPVAGYKWLTDNYTDSAAAGTALASGVKTFNNAINWSDLDRPISSTIAQVARLQGKSVGVVTSVQWSHATPAALGGARSRSRNDYERIANQLIRGGLLDVILGAGNPDFDDNGQPASKKKVYQYVGGRETWRDIEAARATGQTYFGLHPLSTKSEFESLLGDAVPPRVLGTAQVARTLQESRDGAAIDDAPYSDPLVPGVPSLELMTRGALNVLDANPRGLLLVVEGGAIDWANHDNFAARMIEEQIEFIKAIEAVVQWVETCSSWDETLLILTADHETGLIWGPDAGGKRFQPLEDLGPGKVPLVQYNSELHSNSLVPLMARGSGSQSFRDLATQTDPVRGPYADNTDIYRVMARAVTSEAETASPAAAAE